MSSSSSSSAPSSSSSILLENEDLKWMRKRFEKKLKGIKVRINSHLIESVEKYKIIISEVEAAKQRNKKTHTDYRRLKRYDVIGTGESKRLITPQVKEKEKEVRYYAHNQQLFDIIHHAHLETGHGGKNKLEKYIKSKYANVTRETIILYLNLCLICKEKKSKAKQQQQANEKAAHAEREEIMSRSRGRIDVIDMEIWEDDDFKFILSYEEQYTKFVCLRPLRSNSATEVAYNLVDIFCIIGAPAVLQSDSCEEFNINVLREIENMWADLKIIYEQRRDSDSGDSLEHVDDQHIDVYNMIIAWMRDSESRKWSDGLRFCQWKRNTTWNFAINQTPFEAMFNRKAPMNLQQFKVENQQQDQIKIEKI